MTSPRRRPRGLYVPLQANYFMDSAIRAVGNQGELVFLRSLALAKIMNSEGHLHGSNSAELRRGIRSYDDVVAALLLHKLWVSSETVQGYRIRSWLTHNPSNQEAEEALAQDAARKRNARRSAPARTIFDVSNRTPRVESREEKREKDSVRSSGTERTESRPAAPRGSGGAAQPVASDEVRLAAHAEASAAIAAAKAKLKRHPAPTKGSDREKRADFAATMAKLQQRIEEQSSSVGESG